MGSASNEKVEYFGNRDVLMIITLGFLLGILIGVSFGRYNNNRLGQIQKDIDLLREERIKIEETRASFETEDLIVKELEEVRGLKGRTFDSGCTIRAGTYAFNQTYAEKPTVMLSMNGMLIQETDAQGIWEQQVEYEHTNTHIELKKIIPETQEIHVCWLVVPEVKIEAQETPAEQVNV